MATALLISVLRRGADAGIARRGMQWSPALSRRVFATQQRGVCNKEINACRQCLAMVAGVAAIRRPLLTRYNAIRGKASLQPGVGLDGREAAVEASIGGSTSSRDTGVSPCGLSDLSRIPADHHEDLKRCVTVVPDFVSPEEERSLLDMAGGAFAERGLEYARGPGTETGGCIDRYREYDATPAEFGTGVASGVLKRMRGVVKVLAMTRHVTAGESNEGFALDKLCYSNDEGRMALGIIEESVPDAVLYPTHRVIDLEEQGGVITPHVDEQDTFGRFVLVLNLLTDAIVRLRRLPPLSDGSTWQPANSEYVDVAVPRRGIYLLEGLSRYAYAHEVLAAGGDQRCDAPSEQSDATLHWRGQSWVRGRRLSIVARDAGPALSPLDPGVFAPVEIGKSNTGLTGEFVGPGTHWPRRGDARVVSDPLLAKRLQAWLESFGLPAA